MAKKEKEEVEEVNENASVESRINWAEDVVDKNKNLLIASLIIVVVTVAAVFYWSKTNSENELEAQREIFPAQYYFGQDSIDIVLKGNSGNVIGVEEIADDYSGTKAGNLANFYAGAAHLKKGNFEEAINFLKEFSSDDLLVQARAYSLIGDAYMELNQLGEAISYYKKAADNKPTKQYTPRYLMKLGLAYELNNDLASAANSYDRIIKEFYSSSETENAKKYLALVNAKQGKKAE